MKMRKLRVTRPARELPFMQAGDIITDYEVVSDSLTDLIKVNTSNYAKDNKFEENGRLMLWDNEIFWLSFNNIEIIKEEGERKMRYELKNPGKSWWVKGMVVEGEINERSEILEIDSIDICKLNVDIMTKEQIIECMKYPRYEFGKGYLKEIKPTFTMLEKLLLEHQLEMGYKYITRDATENRLNFFKNKPVFNEGAWFGKNEVYHPVFDIYLKELYPFVSCENKEPTLIQDILDRYEVIENEKI